MFVVFRAGLNITSPPPMPSCAVACRQATNTENAVSVSPRANDPRIEGFEKVEVCLRRADWPPARLAPRSPPMNGMYRVDDDSQPRNDPH